MALSILAFYNGLDENAKGYRYLSRYGSLIDELAIFQISIQENGDLRGLPSRNLINKAHSMGIKVIPTITNLTAQGHFSTPLISSLVKDQDLADHVWQNINNLLGDYRCDGVNFDLEKGLPEERSLYTQLIDSWTRKFHESNYLVNIDVPAKTKEESADIWKGIFDYRALGQIVDQVILMTYEEHWPGSPPGSIASLPWVSSVVDYALANIPAQKLFMGIALYGYDWVTTGGAKALSYTAATGLARRYGAPLQWDATQHSTYFRYDTMGQQHVVYFEDLRSLHEKVNLAQKRGLKGIALWEMNLSYPGFWEALPTYL